MNKPRAFPNEGYCRACGEYVPDTTDCDCTIPEPAPISLERIAWTVALFCVAAGVWGFYQAFAAAVR